MDAEGELEPTDDIHFEQVSFMQDKNLKESHLPLREESADKLTGSLVFSENFASQRRNHPPDREQGLQELAADMRKERAITYSPSEVCLM